MGRHERRDDAVLSPDATLLESLPGWGAFTSVVGAVCVRWYGHGWTSVAGVVVLGLATTAALWCAVRRGERARRRGRRAAVVEVTMESRSATCSDDAAGSDMVARRVTP